MNKLLKIIWLPILILIYSCTSVRVLDTEADKNFSLSDYETYNFQDEVNASNDTLLQEYFEEVDLLKKETARQLELRGLQRSANPDLLVNIGSVVQEKVQTRETNIMEAPRYIGQRRYHWKSEQVEVGRYKVGTVTVDLVDNAKNKRVWSGTVEGVIPKNQEKLRKTAEKGMEKLFNRISKLDS